MGAGGQSVGGDFIPWSQLLAEIRFKLLPQVEALNRHDGNFEIVLKDLHGKKDWFMRIIAAEGQELGGIWFGPNPEAPNAAWDGLVRVGKSFTPPVIWDRFQRHSDGS